MLVILYLLLFYLRLNLRSLEGDIVIESFEKVALDKGKVTAYLVSSM